MNVDATKIIAGRKERWAQFYDINSTTRFMFLVRYEKEVATRPFPNRNNPKERTEWAWQRYQMQMEYLNWLDDDTIPYLDVYTGTEIFAEAFGCKVTRPEDNMPFALPLIDKAADVAKIQIPDYGSTPLTLLFDIADELRRRSGDHALMKLVDIQSPMDIAALIWDKNTFYPAMLESPEAVLELAHKVKVLFTAFIDEWFRRYGVEFLAHYPDYYMPKGLTLSEDEVGSVSPALFEKFFLPELTELSLRYGGLGMHCCAHARHQWKLFKQIPDLRLLNFVQPPAVTLEGYRYFARHVAQMHDTNFEWDIEKGASQFPEGCHIVLTKTAETREQAREMCENFRKIY
jgi:hypothetical protein